MSEFRLSRTVYAYATRTDGDCLTNDAGYILTDAFVSILKAVDEKGRRGCHRRLITDGKLFAWVDAEQLTEALQAERACADCEAYSDVAGMTTKADGRVICRDCQTKLDRSVAEKAQPDLFVEQKGLFQ